MKPTTYFSFADRRAAREAQDPADRGGKRDPKSKRRARQLRAKARADAAAAKAAPPPALFTPRPKRVPIVEVIR